MSEIEDSDALVFAFPLYVDSIPSHLLRELLALQEHGFTGKTAKVYCMMNNGFFEGEQNHIAVWQMKLWCEAAGLTWGQAIGTGSGEMYPFIKNIPLGHGPNKNIGRALKNLAHNVLTGSCEADCFISVNYPRFLWKISASSLFWYPRAKANGLKKQDLVRRVDKK